MFMLLFLLQPTGEQETEGNIYKKQLKSALEHTSCKTAKGKGSRQSVQLSAAPDDDITGVLLWQLELHC